MRSKYTGSRWLLVLVTAAAACMAGCGGADGKASTARTPSTLAAAAPVPPLDHEGRWITDAHGRVVILHGWNMVYKLPPYQPAARGFGRDDARFLAGYGFNTVRLGIIWKGLEPEPGEIDEAYLGQTAETVEVLAEQGIFVLLDFHQDMYNERFQGEGFPDWAVLGDARTLPAKPKVGFPGNYLVMPALWRAYDHFWNNDRGPEGRRLQDAFAAAWQVVAKRFRDWPYVLGYNLLNEPWPGSQWPTCVLPIGCPVFDRLFLTPFHKRVIDAIREVDPTTMVWYAPLLTFDFGIPSYHGDTGDPHAGFAFNMYCFSASALGYISVPLPEAIVRRSCELAYQITLANAERQSRQTGDALLVTEFGSTDNIGDLKQVLEALDRHMLSWQQWAYWNTDPSGPTPAAGLIHDLRKPPRGDNIKWDKLRASVRAYPQAVAGTPIAFDFDYNTSLFELLYSTERAGGEGRFPAGSLTQVFVPDLHYPDGYAVDIEGARVVSPPDVEALVLASCPGAEQVSVRVTPEGRSKEGPRSGCSAGAVMSAGQ